MDTACIATRGLRHSFIGRVAASGAALEGEYCSDRGVGRLKSGGITSRRIQLRMESEV